MNKKLKKTRDAIFEHPTRSDVPWVDVEKLFQYYGASITEGRGSRVRVNLKGEVAVFHRPHPERVTTKASLKSVKRFLEAADV